MSRIATLVLAGGKVGADLIPVAEGAPCRALIPLNGRPMLDYVLEAIRTAQETLPVERRGRILIAGDDVPPVPGTVAVAGGKSLVDTLLNGVNALAPDETRLLLATADIPFLTVEAVAEFLRQDDTQASAQFVYPIVEARRCRERFPEMKRTTLRIAEGEFTGGNLALLDPQFLREKEAVIRTAYDRRKDVPALAAMLGPGLILRFLISRLAPGVLTIPLLEREVGRLLGGATVRASITSYAEIGTDVDRYEDVEIARKYLK